MSKFQQKPNRDYFKEDFSEGLMEWAEEMMEDFPELFQPKIKMLDISSVVCDNIVETKPILQFRDFDDVVENLCNVSDLEEGLSKIRKILKDSDYECHYMRTYKIEDTWTVDYGSHSTFFLVKEAK